jgi:hypothetical protein
VRFTKGVSLGGRPDEELDLGGKSFPNVIDCDVGTDYVRTASLRKIYDWPCSDFSFLVVADLAGSAALYLDKVQLAIFVYSKGEPVRVIGQLTEIVSFVCI